MFGESSRPENDGASGRLPSDPAAITAPDSLSGQTAAAATRGARWGLWLHVVGMPMSFVTNVVFGRGSPEALGMYSATQVFIGVFQTFLVFGGSGVLARTVPGMGRDRRFPFLLSYCGLVVVSFSVVWTIGIVFAPGAVSTLLGRFGSPPPALAFVIGTAIVIWSFGTHFLFAVERAPRASVLAKVLLFGYFGFAVVCLTPPGRAFLREPATSMWNATAVLALLAAATTVWALARLPDIREARAPIWHLPAGFWGAVLFIHIGTLIDFAYTTLVPSLVLWWYDVASLGWLSASLRFVALLTVLPATFNAVFTPSFAKLEAAGLRDDALRLAGATIRGCVLAIVPAVLALVLFAPDLVGVFGREYREYARLLSVIGLSVLSVPLVQIGSGMIVAFGEFRVYVVASLVNVVASLVIGVVAVPTWGLDGAAWALTSSAVVQGGVVAWVLRRRLGFRVPEVVGLGWAIGLAALGAVAWLAPTRLAALVIWAVLCGGFAAAARVTPSEIRGLVRRLVGRS